MLTLLLAALSVRPDDVTSTLRFGLAFAGVGLPLAIAFAIHQTRLRSKLHMWEKAWAVVIIVCTDVSLIGAAFYIDAFVGTTLAIATTVTLLFLGIETLMLPPPESPDTIR
jgi:hypothetical protein